MTKSAWRDGAGPCGRVASLLFVAFILSACAGPKEPGAEFVIEGSPVVALIKAIDPCSAQGYDSAVLLRTEGNKNYMRCQ
jgi:hypothetical protein